MKKEEREKWLDIIDDFEHDFMAIIAYQFTRIAGQGEPITRVAEATEFIELPDAEGNVHHFHRHDLESYRDGYFSYKPQGGFKTILSAKDMEDIIGTAKPAPDVPAGTPDDALVEVIQKTSDALHGLSSHGVDGLDDIVQELEDALAAHESGSE